MLLLLLLLLAQQPRSQLAHLVLLPPCSPVPLAAVLSVAAQSRRLAASALHSALPLRQTAAAAVCQHRVPRRLLPSARRLQLGALPSPLPSSSCRSPAVPPLVLVLLPGLTLLPSSSCLFDNHGAQEQEEHPGGRGRACTRWSAASLSSTLSLMSSHCKPSQAEPVEERNEDGEPPSKKRKHRKDKRAFTQLAAAPVW